MAAFSHPQKTLDGDDNLLIAILVIAVKTSCNLADALNLSWSRPDPLQGTHENRLLSSQKKERKRKTALKLMRGINNRLQRVFAMTSPPLFWDFEQFGND